MNMANVLGPSGLLKKYRLALINFTINCSRRDTPHGQRALNAQEARLEFYVFEDWLFSYLVTKNQQVITHRLCLKLSLGMMSMSY